MNSSRHRSPDAKVMSPPRDEPDPVVVGLFDDISRARRNDVVRRLQWPISFLRALEIAFPGG